MHNHIENVAFLGGLSLCAPCSKSKRGPFLTPNTFSCSSCRCESEQIRPRNPSNTVSRKVLCLSKKVSFRRSIAYASAPSRNDIKINCTNKDVDTLSITEETEAISTRPTQAIVNLGALRANYLAIKAAVGGAKVIAVLKANAYGHGKVAVARFLEEQVGADYFAVALPEEGLMLRKAGVMTPILVLGGLVPDQIAPSLRNNLTLTAHSIDKLKAIDEVAQSLRLIANVHLEVDTGMERVGVHWYNAAKFIHFSNTCTNCFVEGFSSHFANSDSQDTSSAQLQLSRFHEALANYEKLSIPRPPLCHIANSGGILQLPDSHLDAVRPGIALYGVYPSLECMRSIPLQPCLSLISRVVYFKVVEAGVPISYGHTWTAPTKSRVVTVPIGYGDGYPRALSNRGQVLIRGRRYPVVGRVCMDQLMVNISWDEAYNGDPVVLLGSHPTPSPHLAPPDSISVDDLARWCGAIPYEILTGIAQRVPRVYVGQAPSASELESELDFGSAGEP